MGDLVMIEHPDADVGMIKVPGEYLDHITGIDGATIYEMGDSWWYEDAHGNVGESDTHEGIMKIALAQTIENE